MELSTSLELLFIATFVLHRIYVYFCGNFSLFRSQGVPGPRPIPFFGTWWRSWETNPHETTVENHKQYGKLWCTFRGRQPVLHVLDVELLRSIYVKDSFEHFGKRNRRPVTGENEYVNKTLSMLVGDEWKQLRHLSIQAISPLLIRERVEFGNESLLEFVEEWQRIADTNGRMDLRVEAEILCEELMMNYTAGVKLGTLGNPNHPFVINARKTMEAGERSFFMTITQLYPKLLQWLCPVIDTGNEYFVDLAKKLLQERSESRSTNDQASHHATLEPDLLDRLVDCLDRNGNEKKGYECIDEVIAIAQITSTILTGYDWGTVLTRVIHCLTVNEEVQERCRREIGESLPEYQGEITFPLLTGLPYIEQCIREALRLYPTTSMTYRVCTKDKQYPNLFIPKGTSIECPIYLLQRDPKLYPEPMKYNPDRFAPENAKERDPFLFFSFGQGSRSCFAQKFSMIVLKQCLVHLLPKFELFPIAETKEMINFTTGPSGMLTARDMHVGIRRVNTVNTKKF